MKKTLLPVFIFLFCQSFVSMAAISYSIKINDEGYDLNINFSLKPHHTLQSVRYALTNEKVITSLSSKIQLVTKTPPDAQIYDTLMEVKSFGITSRLLSKCQEHFNQSDKNALWSRSCILDTKKEDGGKYMENKTDSVECSKVNNTSPLKCHFSIKGKAKTFSFLGIALLDHKNFSVKAKKEALQNFFKLYLFIQSNTLSFKLINDEFENSPLKIELDNFEINAEKILKTENTYSRSVEFSF